MTQWPSLARRYIVPVVTVVAVPAGAVVGMHGGSSILGIRRVSAEIPCRSLGRVLTDSLAATGWQSAAAAVRMRTSTVRRQQRRQRRQSLQRLQMRQPQTTAVRYVTVSHWCLVDMHSSVCERCKASCITLYLTSLALSTPATSRLAFSVAPANNDDAVFHSDTDRC